MRGYRNFPLNICTSFMFFVFPKDLLLVSIPGNEPVIKQFFMLLTGRYLDINVKTDD